MKGSLRIAEVPRKLTCRSPRQIIRAFALGLLMAAVMRCSGEPRQAAVEIPAVRGEAFFLTHCASCHGPHGRGAALAASAKPPDFQSPAWQSSRTDEQILQTILRGKRGTAMLGWPMLSNQERADLLAFIRSLGSGSDETRTNSGG